MTVYIDNFNAPFRKYIMCHMIADTIEELHLMADKIGIDRRYFQKGSFPHYDVSLSKKKLAIENGAKAVSCKDLCHIMRKITELNPRGGKRHGEASK